MNISPVNFANINFSARKNNYSVPKGIDYSAVDEFRTNNFSKFELSTAAIDGRLTQEMIDKMILERIPKTIRHAQRFVLEHPEFDNDEVAQQLIAHVVELANKYKGQSSGNFNNYAYHNECYFLETLAKKHSKELDWQDYNCDMRTIEDNYLEKALRNLRDRDVQGSVSSLDIWEEDVIRKRYGLDGDEPKNLEICAEEFDADIDRVKDIEKAAIRHLSSAYRLVDILVDTAYLKAGDDNDKLAHLIDRDVLF